MGPRTSPYNNKLLLLASLSCLVGRSYAWGSNCSYDVYGVERCDGLSYGARVGIAVAILALLVLLLGVLFARRRRLARQQQEALANGRLASSQAYSQQQQGVPMYGYAPQQGYNNNNGNYNNGGPQYYESPQAQTYNYGPSAETWQPPPPKYEPPPPDAQNSFKGPEGSSAGYNVNPPAASDGYAPPAGPPPNMSSTQPQQGNDNRV